MKRTVKVLAIALLGMSLAVACKNAPTEEVGDTMPAIDTTVIDSVVEEPVVEEPVVEEPVKKAPAKKQQTKKDEGTTVQVDASKMSISNSNGTGVTINKDGGAKVNTANGEAKVDASKMSINTSKGSVNVNGGGVTIKKN